MKVVVVGGGIGGLATAVALGQRGWDVEVIERAPDFTAVGTGLSLWPNALRALDALGLSESIRKHALIETSGGVQDPSGRWLTRTDTKELERRYGQVAMLHRADLLDVLRSAVPSDALRAGTTVEQVHPDGTVIHSGGESRGDLVVGADGIRSLVRSSVWPDAPEPRYVGYSAWRLVTQQVPVNEGTETWGRGERFGYVPLLGGRVYVYAAVNTPPGAASDGLPGLRRRFGHWHEPIPALLEAAEGVPVRHDDLYELPRLRTYVSGKIALVGDAAHAMTPDLGQGACQALEDAVVLAMSMDGGGGLDAYDRKRRARTQMIARRSHWIGAVSQWSSPVATGTRNRVLRTVPQSLFVRSLAPVLSWTP